MPNAPAAASRLPTTTRRRTHHRGQAALLLASVTLALASFLPWIETVFGSFSGMAGAGVWTFYAAVWGIAGALMPWRRIALAHAAIVAAAATALPAWQLTAMYARGLTRGWAPGTGLLLALAAGSLALRATWQLRRV